MNEMVDEFVVEWLLLLDGIVYFYYLVNGIVMG